MGSLVPIFVGFILPKETHVGHLPVSCLITISIIQRKQNHLEDLEQQFRQSEVTAMIRRKVKFSIVGNYLEGTLNCAILIVN